MEQYQPGVDEMKDVILRNGLTFVDEHPAGSKVVNIIELGVGEKPWMDEKGLRVVAVHIKETPESENTIDHAVIKPISVANLKNELAVIDHLNQTGAAVHHIPVTGYVTVDAEHALYMTPYLMYLKPLDYQLRTLPAVAAGIKRRRAEFDADAYVYENYTDAFRNALKLLEELQAAGIQHNDFEPQNIGSDLGGLVAHDFVFSEIYADGNIPEEKKREDRVQFIDKMLRVGVEIGIPTQKVAAHIRELGLEAEAPQAFMQANPVQ